MATFEVRIIRRNGFEIHIQQAPRKFDGWFIRDVFYKDDRNIRVMMQHHANNWIGYNYFEMARPYPKYILKKFSDVVALAEREAAKGFKRETLAWPKDLPF